MKKVLYSIFIRLWIMLVASLTACEPGPDLTRSFTIKEGEHYSSSHYPEMLQQNTLAFQATFGESAVYNFSDAALQTNKNKLLGFSDCNARHHENSARFAWQWFNDRLEIFAYCYVDGIRVESFIGPVSLHIPASYRIELREDSYVFSLNDFSPVSIKRGNVCQRGMYYLLWPYFGGSTSAPHDITIKIKRIY